MDWLQKRLEDLNKRLIDKIDILGRYERELDYENEPRNKKKLEDNISNIKIEINEISADIDALQRKLHASDKFNQVRFEQAPNLTTIRQQYYDEYLERKKQKKN